jgi:toxin YoeB
MENDAVSVELEWSRRIDDTHRLVYTVEDDAVVVVGCRYHYGP